MLRQSEPRVSKRMPCNVIVSGRRHSGLVLNVSPRGLFVQTSARVNPGTPVSVSLVAPTQADSIELHATVVWKRAVPQHLLRVAQGGCGLRIDSAAEGYYEYLSTVLPSASPA